VLLAGESVRLFDIVGMIVILAGVVAITLAKSTPAAGAPIQTKR
jgi:multidrug transporter EmrE-like cation transporter